ncbi:phage tail assembly chaperone [Photobacterium proteolyticum]|nr:phage tail assembly chaperone [Photobacterium proteolyticum]
MGEVREIRNRLLVEADRLVNKAEDKGLDSTPQRQYRDWLRDVPETYKDNPEAVEWKEPPLPQPSA